MFKTFLSLLLVSLILMIAGAHAGTGLPGGTRSDLEHEDAADQDTHKKKEKKADKKGQKKDEEAREESDEPRPDPSPRR